MFVTIVYHLWNVPVLLTERLYLYVYVFRTISRQFNNYFTFHNKYEKGVANCADERFLVNEHKYKIGTGHCTKDIFERFVFSCILINKLDPPDHAHINETSKPFDVSLYLSNEKNSEIIHARGRSTRNWCTLALICITLTVNHEIN
jgi:hypothetical protein